MSGEKKPGAGAQALVAIALLGGGYWFFKPDMGDIERQVAEDAVAQYEIAKRGGDKMQTCVQAGMVSAAYLQAKDEEKYNEWKATEKMDCRAVGMPQ